MQIKEFEALTLKECLQQVRSEMGTDAVILETRKFRKGGLMGVGAHDAVAIVAATGITIDSERQEAGGGRERTSHDSSETIGERGPIGKPANAISSEPVSPSRTGASARIAARGVYGTKSRERVADDRFEPKTVAAPQASPASVDIEHSAPAPTYFNDTERIQYLESAIGEIRECLVALQREQRVNHDRTVSAVISAVAPAVSAVNAAGFAAYSEELQPRFPELQERMRNSGVSDFLVHELFDQLPDMGAWSTQAQDALAVSALRDLITRRVQVAGPIALTPGRLKAVALIGPTGVGKTTTVAKLAAHFALNQGKRVALLTIDTYRIAAVEQVRAYGQIIGVPVSVAYNHAEVPAILQQFADYDLILIDTAGRSQQHAMQIAELKSLLDTVDCETHLVLAANTKEGDMVEAAQRFAAARVDRLLFSKLDETSSFGTLLNVADGTGIPLSYISNGQKVPEDLETADGGKLADLILE